MSKIKSPSVKFILSAFFLSAIFFQCSDDSADEPQPQEVVPDDTDTRTDEDAVSPAACSTCTYVVPANTGTIDGKTLGFKPGDVICLNSAAKYGSLWFKNIVGTAAKPIIITNCGGTADIVVSGRPYNLKVSTSKFFRVTGGNTANAYGIKFSGSTSNGVVLCDFSTNFEVDHIEVHHVGFAGLMAKTDPTCDDATLRGNFTMRDVSIHDNYIHDTKGEGYYIGHSSYAGYNTDCGVRLPHTIEGIKIFKNLMKNNGWDGIQLSCATKNAAVYGNTIENYGTENKTDQKNGILLGGGTGGLCYGNYVNKGTGTGITAFGLGDNIIHNNVVVNAGGSGLFCDERSSVGPGFKFFYNTVINPKEEGIRIYSETMPDNMCVNNIIVNPGTYTKYGENAYVLKLKSVKADISNNYFTLNINDVKFVNAGAGNFNLQSSSPAINAGRNLSSFSIANDFYNTARVKGTATDIGAAEF